MLFYFVTVFALIFSTGYLLLMLRYTLDWIRLPEFRPQNFDKSIRISVIVPARNEEQIITACLKSIAVQDYPEELFEIIMADDQSEDNTVFMAERLKIPNLRIISNHGLSGKKELIGYAVAQASGELIVCTDADCVATKHWLKNMATLYSQKKAKFIAAPVQFIADNSIFEKFQELDFLGMMAITGAGISGRYLYMCNGANLAYPKSVFEEVGGFAGIDNKASGDDMLLMQKIAAKYPEDIVFLKSNTAYTGTVPCKTLKEFWQQRLRWASKSGSYLQASVNYQLALVWLFMFSILLTAFSSFFDLRLAAVLLSQFLVKGIADFILLNSATGYFYRKELMKVFLPSVFMHWAYILSVGFWSNFSKKYSWKGRKVS